MQWSIAARSLARRPPYTMTAILMLVLGIGATSALFSLVDTVLLKPLAYPDPGRLVAVLEASPSLNKKDSLIAPARLEDWNRLNQSFEAIGASYAENATDTSGSEPERLAGRRVSPRYFDVFQMPPVIGRTFSHEEELDGGPGSVVISYSFWTRRFGQNPRAVGQRLVLGGRGYTIVGVMPKEFSTPSIDLWIPAQIAPFLMRIREARFYSGVGRMKPGVTIAQAQADLTRVQRQLGEQYPRTDKDWAAVVRDLKEVQVGSYRRTLLLVFGAVALLLAISIANVSGLTLAQLHAREREMAVRSSIGASRGQIIAAIMREVLLLAAAGAILGGAVAFLAVHFLSTLFSTLPRIAELRFDWRVLLFTAAASLIAALIFGLIPAIHATRVDLAPMLAESTRSVSGGNRRLQRALVVAQLAFTVLLLSSAGLLLRTYLNLTRVDAGFDTSRTITFHVGAAWDEDRARIGRMQQEIVDELERVPGVEAAGFTNFLPATGATLKYQVVVEGIASTEEASTFTVGERTVTAGYMQALKIPLLAGGWCPAFRPLASKDPLTMMVNKRFVDLFANGQNVVGRQVRFAQDGPGSAQFTISGVVGDVREDGLNASPGPYAYACLNAGSWPDPEYVVRTRSDPRALAHQIVPLVHEVAPGRAVFGVKMLDTLVDDALEQPRLNMRFLGLFAVAAMLLASVGLYSVIALVVAARTREIGVRMALGAAPSRIAALIFSNAARLFGAGIAIGLALTAAVDRIIQSALFEVSPLDAASLAAAVAILGVVSGIAAWLPARRASAIDPLDAMRDS